MEVDASLRLVLTSSTSSSIPSSIVSSIMTRSDTEDKVLENRLRRVAARRGLRLEKSRRRDKSAIDYGYYCLMDTYTNTIVSRRYPTSGRDEAYNATLAEIEAMLEAGAGWPEKIKGNT
jgi:hypothetical protein